MLPLMKENTVRLLPEDRFHVYFYLQSLEDVRQSLRGGSRFRFCDGDGEGGEMGAKVRISVC